MKKLLSILLAAFVLCLGCAAGASAALPDPGALEAQSLQFELPVVTAIEAVWNGELLLDSWLNPAFNPQNVTVTVYFEEGGPEALHRWYGSGYEWYWQVFYDFDRDAGRVTFTYRDTNWEDYEELPQSGFSVPADYLAQFIASQEVVPLKLGEASPPVQGRYEHKIFSFTPAKSGTYQFASESGYAQDFAIVDADLNIISCGYTRPVESLEAGKSYYVFAYSWSDAEYSVTVEEYSNRYSLWDAIRTFFQGVGFWLFLSPFFLLVLLYMIPINIWVWISRLFS